MNLEKAKNNIKLCLLCDPFINPTTRDIELHEKYGRHIKLVGGYCLHGWKPESSDPDYEIHKKMIETLGLANQIINEVSE